MEPLCPDHSHSEHQRSCRLDSGSSGNARSAVSPLTTSKNTHTTSYRISLAGPATRSTHGCHRPTTASCFATSAMTQFMLEGTTGPVEWPHQATSSIPTGLIARHTCSGLRSLPQRLAVSGPNHSLQPPWDGIAPSHAAELTRWADARRLDSISMETTDGRCPDGSKGS